MVGTQVATKLPPVFFPNARIASDVTIDPTPAHRNRIGRQLRRLLLDRACQGAFALSRCLLQIHDRLPISVRSPPWAVAWTQVGSWRSIASVTAPAARRIG